MKQYRYFFPIALLLVSWPMAASAQDTAIKHLTPPNERPKFEAAADFVPKDNTVVIKLSEYTGYSGLIYSNGGLEPNDQSFTAKNHGFKIKLIVDENDAMNRVHSGEVAGLAATPDMLAAYDADRANVNAVCPVLFDFSRGADQILMRAEHKSLRDAVGQTFVVAQYSCSDFFLRYLCLNNQLDYFIRPNLKTAPDKKRINIVFTEQVDQATEVFAEDIKNGRNRFAGCGGWTPMSLEAVQKSQGKAYVFTSSKNHLVIADALFMNRGFVKNNRAMALGVVHAILDGNRRLREAMAKGSKAEFEVVAKGLTTDKESPWSADDVLKDLRNIHLANFGLNQTFLNDTMPSGGSFAQIFRDGSKCYGTKAEPDSVAKFSDASLLAELAKAHPELANEQVELAAIESKGDQERLIVQKDIQFQFERNVFTKIDELLGDNRAHLQGIAEFLKVSPGSSVKLIGHLDDSQAKSKGPAFRKEYEPKAVAMSLARATAVRNSLVERYQIAEDQIKVEGQGWKQPLGADPEKNRRVEVRIFTLE